MKRNVFFISDGTGITAEALGHSLITQFDTIEFEATTIPYINNQEKAQKVVEQINEIYDQEKLRPLVFATLVNPEIYATIKESRGKLIDLFKTFIDPLEKELGIKSSFTIGLSHSMADFTTYKNRIDAINYTLAHDDGVKPHNYGQADVVLVGVSRSGKTPTCLYLALQFGILAANYPLTDDDFKRLTLPESLKPYKDKLYGLVVDAKRLHAIRNERRPNSQYASMQQCRKEINELIAMYQHENVPYLNTTHYSIEEIATKILAKAGIQRRTF